MTDIFDEIEEKATKHKIDEIYKGFKKLLKINKNKNEYIQNLNRILNASNNFNKTKTKNAINLEIMHKNFTWKDINEIYKDLRKTMYNGKSKRKKILNIRKLNNKLNKMQNFMRTELLFDDESDDDDYEYTDTETSYQKGKNVTPRKVSSLTSSRAQRQKDKQQTLKDAPKKDIKSVSKLSPQEFQEKTEIYQFIDQTIKYVDFAKNALNITENIRNFFEFDEWAGDVTITIPDSLDDLKMRHGMFLVFLKYYWEPYVAETGEPRQLEEIYDTLIKELPKIEGVHIQRQDKIRIFNIDDEMNKIDNEIVARLDVNDEKYAYLKNDDDISSIYNPDDDNNNGNENESSGTQDSDLATFQASKNIPDIDDNDSQIRFNVNKARQSGQKKMGLLPLAESNNEAGDHDDSGVDTDNENPINQMVNDLPDLTNTQKRGLKAQHEDDEKADILGDDGNVMQTPPKYTFDYKKQLTKEKKTELYRLQNELLIELLQNANREIIYNVETIHKNTFKNLVGELLENSLVMSNDSYRRVEYLLDPLTNHKSQVWSTDIVLFCKNTKDYHLLKLNKVRAIVSRRHKKVPLSRLLFYE